MKSVVDIQVYDPLITAFIGASGVAVLQAAVNEVVPRQKQVWIFAAFVGAGLAYLQYRHRQDV